MPLSTWLRRAGAPVSESPVRGPGMHGWQLGRQAVNLPGCGAGARPTAEAVGRRLNHRLASPLAG